MSYDYRLKTNSTETITETFLDGDGNVVDVSNATTLKFFLEGPPSADEPLLVNDTATTVSDGSDGEVTYSLDSSQTGLVGPHEAEFYVELPDGSKQRYPTGEEYLDIQIGPSLGTITDPTELDPVLGATLDFNGNDAVDGGDINAETVTAGGLVDRSSGTTRDVDDISPDVSVSLGGGAPDATTYAIGTVIRDSDTPGSLWYVYDDSVSGGVRRLDPGSASNPITEEVGESNLPSDIIEHTSGKVHDATAANIQTAIDNEPGDGGVTIPPGFYGVDSTITLDKSSDATATFTLDVHSNAKFQPTGNFPAWNIKSLEEGEIGFLNIVDNNDNTTSAYGLKIEQCKNSVFAGWRVEGTYNGVEITDDSRLNWCAFAKASVRNNGHYIHDDAVGSGNQTNAWTFGTMENASDGGSADPADGVGLLLDIADDICVAGRFYSKYYDTGLKIVDSIGFSFQNAVLENNTTEDVILEAAERDVKGWEFQSLSCITGNTSSGLRMVGSAGPNRVQEGYIGDLRAAYGAGAGVEVGDYVQDVTVENAFVTNMDTALDIQATTDADRITFENFTEIQCTTSINVVSGAVKRCAKVFNPSLADSKSIASADKDVVAIGGIYKEDNANEEPQRSYDAGDLVEYKDTGDGTGDGLYLVLSDGTTLAKVSDTISF